MKPRAWLRFLRGVGHREWIPAGVRYRVLYRLANPNLMPDQPFEVDFHGFRYSGSLGTYLDWWVYFFGGYEQAQLRLLAELAGDELPLFVDVGANVGHHSLYMARHSSLIHAFEPYAVVRTSLERKIRENRLENVVVHPVGLGEESAELPFFAPRYPNTGTGSFVVGHAAANNVPSTTLRVVNGDEYFEAHGIRGVGLMKIDVEGFELHVLRGLSQTLERDRPTIVMELGGGAAAEELLAAMPHDYSVLRFHPEGTTRYSLAPFRWGQSGEVVLLPGERAARIRSANLAAAS